MAWLSSRRKLTFRSAKARFGLVTPIVLIVTASAIIIGGDTQKFTPPLNSAGIVVVLIVIACWLLVQASRRWIIEADLTTQRLTIYRQILWLRPEIDLHCSFDECSRVGTFAYSRDPETDRFDRYGVYVEVKRGGRNDIPLQYLAFESAARVASHLSTATGIPRLDRCS
jgi:hypothetical protein